MSEEWRPIPGDERYEVSDCGRVRSLWTRGRNFERLRDIPRQLRFASDRDGYRTVVLYRSGKGRRRRVHRLVLLAFRGPPRPGEEAMHLDGDPGNNRSSNLRWGTASENQQMTRLHGTMELRVRHARETRQATPLEERQEQAARRAAAASRTMQRWPQATREEWRRRVAAGVRSSLARRTPAETEAANQKRAKTRESWGAQERQKASAAIASGQRARWAGRSSEERAAIARKGWEARRKSR